MTFMMALKNIFVHKKRSFSLFFYIVLVTVVSIVCINLLYSIKNKMEVSIVNCLTGEVLVRNSETAENQIYTVNIDELSDVAMEEDYSDDILKAMKEEYGKANVTERIRYNGMISVEDKSEVAMIIGINPEFERYKDSLRLSGGKYLENKNKDEIIVTSALAESLGVDVDEEISIYSVTKDNETKEMKLKVVGIADPEGLAIFSLPIVYVDLDTAQAVSGYEDGQYTDIVVIGEGNAVSVKSVEKLLDNKKLSSKDVTVVNYESISGFVLDYMNLFTLIFMVLIVALACIIGILVINIIVMMGMEKRVEIGILKAIGFGRKQITSIYFWEMMITIICSIIIGTIISVITLECISIKNISGDISNLLGKTFEPVISPQSTLVSILLILFILIIFCFVPCWKITGLRPVEALKED